MEYPKTIVVEVRLFHRTKTYMSVHWIETNDPKNDLAFIPSYNRTNLDQLTKDIIKNLDRGSLKEYSIYEILGWKIKSEKYLRPLSEPELMITSPVGHRCLPSGTNYHSALDLSLPGGSNGKLVRAIGAGVISKSQNDGRSGYGKWIEVYHGNGLYSKYGHLSKRSVNLGQWINGGDQIGKVGNTGNSSGPHLHLELIKITKNKKSFLDPNKYFQKKIIKGRLNPSGRCRVGNTH
ncbi:MAG: M23 family metallopeptidase [Cyclobacteriaceae bacterium]|nr:M23 family metallopeptidase [Cyclobacteriaceae bacterium]